MATADLSITSQTFAGLKADQIFADRIYENHVLLIPGRRGNWVEWWVECAARCQAGHLSPAFVFFFFLFLGLVSVLLNGGSDLSVLTNRNPCVGKSHSQRVAAFTC